MFPDPNGTRYQFWDETIEVLVGIIIGKRWLFVEDHMQLDIDDEQLSFPNGN